MHGAVTCYIGRLQCQIGSGYARVHQYLQEVWMGTEQIKHLLSDLISSRIICRATHAPPDERLGTICNILAPIDVMFILFLIGTSIKLGLLRYQLHNHMSFVSHV